MTLDDTIERIKNWARWARPNASRIASCKSLESRYRPPPMYERPELKVDIDLKDAIILEQCIVQLPRKHLILTVYQYVFPTYSHNVWLRKAKCSRTEFQEIMDNKRCEVMIHNRLIRNFGND